jgi:hypothetical protein
MPPPVFFLSSTLLGEIESLSASSPSLHRHHASSSEFFLLFFPYAS